ncbi:hypothetical protein [Pyruvatibacter sp.]|uniref:hypothetical protein n=1 Tax=Pyruvatibacter sp. TaxID=1981328 RepID=UPI0032645246
MRDLESLGKSPEINAFQRKVLLLVRDISAGKGVDVVGEIFPADDELTYVKGSCEDAGVTFFLYYSGAHLVSANEDRLFEVESYSDLSSLMREFLERFDLSLVRKTAT